MLDCVYPRSPLLISALRTGSDTLSLFLTLVRLSQFMWLVPCPLKPSLNPPLAAAWRSCWCQVGVRRRRFCPDHFLLRCVSPAKRSFSKVGDAGFEPATPSL